VWRRHRLTERLEGDGGGEGSRYSKGSEENSRWRDVVELGWQLKVR
jgi:hypothetical protein